MQITIEIEDQFEEELAAMAKAEKVSIQTLIERIVLERCKIFLQGVRAGIDKFRPFSPRKGERS